MLQDPIEYPEPELFEPERFVLKEGNAAPRDPNDVVFGFGRRHDILPYLGLLLLTSCLESALGVTLLWKMSVIRRVRRH